MSCSRAGPAQVVQGSKQASKLLAVSMRPCKPTLEHVGVARATLRRKSLAEQPSGTSWQYLSR